MPPLDNEMNANFEKRTQKRINATHHVARRGGTKSDWIHEVVWAKLLAKWNTPKWQKKSQQAKTNSASTKNGALHTGQKIVLPPIG